MADWAKMMNVVIKDCADLLVERFYEDAIKIEAMRTPEERERWAKERERLAAIEAAKSPEQKLREKQEACSHDFNKKNVCEHCKLEASADFVRGYELGKQNAECDCDW